MNYAEIKTCDIANGPGVRVSLFVSGCNHRCKNCFNEVAWDFGYGTEFTRKTMDLLIEELRPYYVRGLTLLGGEPMEYQNQVGLLPFVKRVKEELPDKDIWCFSTRKRAAGRRTPAICLTVRSWKPCARSGR